MTIVKLEYGDEILKLYNYFDNTEKAIMVDKGTFLMACKTGRAYKCIVNNRIVAGLCMYETKDRLFIPHMHIDKGYRKSKLGLKLYRLVIKYAKDKKKKIYTTMEDISQVKGFLTPSGEIDGEILYEVNTDRIRECQR